MSGVWCLHALPDCYYCMHSLHKTNNTYKLYVVNHQPMPTTFVSSFSFHSFLHPLQDYKPPENSFKYKIQPQPQPQPPCCVQGLSQCCFWGVVFLFFAVTHHLHARSLASIICKLTNWDIRRTGHRLSALLLWWCCIALPDILWKFESEAQLLAYAAMMLITGNFNTCSA